MGFSSHNIKKTGHALAGLLVLCQIAQAAPRPFPPDGANEPAFFIWTKLKSDFALERDLIGRCRTAADCPSPAARQFVAIVEEGLQYESRARIAHINRAANLAIRPQIKPARTWTSPLTTLAAGTGDCKQYAVLKYAALLEVGFTADQLRIVIVEDKARQATHAVVAVRDGTQWLVLNNRSSALVDFDEFVERYALLWRLDRGASQETASQAETPEAGS
jgi:predicted transglutaminase-like cysteine proteinase